MSDRDLRSEEFWAAVAIGKPDDCWPWTKCCYGRSGYGKWSIRVDGKCKQVDAHRAAFELTYGPILAGGVVRHSCDAPSCCNPKHLLNGTQTDNIRDMYARGRNRGRGTFGENQGSSKLKEADVITIRREYVRGTNQFNRGNAKALAARFGVHPSLINGIVADRSWRHLLRQERRS